MGQFEFVSRTGMRLVNFLPIAYVLSEYIVPDSLSSRCHPDGLVEIYFEYEPADAYLDNVSVGNCPAGSAEIGFQQSDNSYVLTFNTENCSNDTDSLRQEIDVHFSQGIVSSSGFLAMKQHKIRKVCDFSYGHKVIFDFSIEKTDTVHDDPTATGGIIFQTSGYTDYAKTIAINSDTELFTGQQVWMNIQPVVAPEIEETFNFTPQKCVFRNTEQSFTLFDASINDCQQEFADLNFSLTYDKDTKTWCVTYKLFTFGENTFNEYFLECDVYACYDGTENSDQCAATAEVCDPNYEDNSSIWNPSSGSSGSSMLNKVFIYPQSVDEIWVFDFDEESETFSLDKKIEGWADAPISGTYDWGNGYVVFNQDTGLVNWFSIGGGHYIKKVLRYTLETGAFHSMGDLATNFNNADTVVWTPEYGVLIMKNSGSIENPSPNTGMEQKTDLPNIPQPGFYDAQAVYADGKVYIAPGNTGHFQYLDLASEEWTVLDTPFSQGKGGYFQMVKWGNKWVYIRYQQIIVFQVSD